MTQTSLQHLYNTLISMANRTYETAYNENALTNYWLGRSDAYEAAAALVDITASIHGHVIVRHQTMRELDVEQARREEAAFQAFEKEVGHDD